MSLPKHEDLGIQISSWILPLLLIVALGAALRLHGIGESSFWHDEFCSVESSTGRGLAHVQLPRGEIIEHPPLLATLGDAPPWWRVWTSLRLDNHPPLYFLLLRLWREVFQGGDVTARAMSIVPSLASIALIFWAVLCGEGLRHTRSNELPGQDTRATVNVMNSSSAGAALWSAILMALATPQVHFAQETRGYSLLVALEIAACVALLVIERRGASGVRMVALFASVLAMMLTHYFAIAAVIAMVIYAIIRLRGTTRKAILAGLLAAGIVYAVIWGPFLWQQRQSVEINNAWQIEPAAGHAVRTIERLAILPVRLVSESAATVTPWAYAGAIAYLLPIFVVRKKPHMLLWALLFVLPVIMVAGIDVARHARHLEFSRYTILAAPGLYVLLSGFSGRLRWALPILAVIISLLGLNQTYSTDRQWQQIADVLHNEVKPDDLLVYASGGHDDWYAGSLYLGISYYAPNLPAPILILDNHSAVPPIQPGRRVWIISGTSAMPLQNFHVEDHVLFPTVGSVTRGYQQ